MSSARRKRLTLLATIVGSTIVFIDSTVVNVALPALRRDLHAGLATQQWVVDAYLLTLGSLVLVGGSVGDLFGRRRVFALGVAGFGVTSLLCAAAPSSELLVAARALQGVAAALLVPSSLGIITATFADEERGRAIGAWTAATAAAITVGPPIGGVLVDAASWRWIFLLNVPLVMLTLYLIKRAVEESVLETPRPRVDVVGAILCTLGLGGPVFALIEQPLRGWTDPAVLIPLIIGSTLLPAFVLYELRVRAPMMPPALFRNRNFAAGNLATLLIYGGLGVAGFLISIFIQQVAGYSALEAGLAFAPVSVLLATLSSRFGGLAERFGARLFMTIGPIVGGVGLLLMARADEHVNYVDTLLPALVAFGLGLALTVAPLTAAVLGAVEQRRAGTASGVNNAVARIAALVAIAAVGTVVSARFASALDDRLAGERLAEPARAAVIDAKTRPLGGASVDNVARPERARLAHAFEDASVSGFRLGMVFAALLLFAGGAISAAGIRTPRSV